MALLLVRHGRTEANAAGLLLGRADPDLDDTGRRQAAALTRAISHPGRVISSPLRRAVETASWIARDIDGDVVIDERWIELDYGELDGTPLGEVPAEVWATWRSDVDFVPPGGESLRALGQRVGAALDELAAEAEQHDVVVVTHVSPIKAAVAWALAVGDEVCWRTFVAPASITRVGIGPFGPVLRSFNDVAHLDA